MQCSEDKRKSAPTLK